MKFNFHALKMKTIQWIITPTDFIFFFSISPPATVAHSYHWTHPGSDLPVVQWCCQISQTPECRSGEVGGAPGSGGFAVGKRRRGPSLPGGHRSLGPWTWELPPAGRSTYRQEKEIYVVWVVGGIRCRSCSLLWRKKEWKRQKEKKHEASTHPSLLMSVVATV